jgi:protein tyrosine phosphatase (PTP) superfamily phosphohydrolase (DUF442 family)
MKSVIAAVFLLCAALPAESSEPARIDTRHLPNAIRVTDKIISGGVPDGAAGFEELKALGVKTVVSVDGAQPEVALAEKSGLRYVHLPHGYDGIAPERAKELAKAVRDLPGPIYIHCHHGKHRSPAAAAAACVASGLLAESQALAVLKLAGTSPAYRGLFQTVERARPLSSAELDAVPCEFRSAIEVPPMAAAMVGVEHAHDHLTAFAKARWQPLPEEPDLVPDHEALLLKEQFTELLRTKEAAARGKPFVALLREGELAAGELEARLRGGAMPAKLGEALQRVTANCKSCHEKSRDVPLGDK